MQHSPVYAPLSNNDNPMHDIHNPGSDILLPVVGLSMKKTCLFSPYVTSTILPRHSQINSFISTYLEQSSSLLLKRSCRTCPEPENASLARSTQAVKRKGTSSSMRVSFDTFVQEVTFLRWFQNCGTLSTLIPTPK